MANRWPATLWVVRHGESAGNVAARQAVGEGGHHFRLAMRDADVPLSATGEEQADALGRWFAHGSPVRPDIILSSPYIGARETARRVLSACSVPERTPILVDERLREKETGILDGLTPEGVAALHPDQAEQRKTIGKFYHRSPGGENWCDVILRLRGVVDRISLHHADQHVLIVAHEVVVFCLRYILENLDEEGILAIDAQGDVANCAITEYRFDGITSTLLLHNFNETGPVSHYGAPITEARDQIVARRG
jgi:broad specificity phosphatase PhoE